MRSFVMRLAVAVLVAVFVLLAITVSQAQAPAAQSSAASAASAPNRRPSTESSKSTRRLTSSLSKAAASSTAAAAPVTPAPAATPAPAPAAPAQPATVQANPTSDELLNACGMRLVKVFPQFGTPSDIEPVRNSTDPSGDTVIFIYGDGSWGLAMKNKAVFDCFFWGAWKDPVRGIRIGDSSDSTLKVLGTPMNTYKDNNGVLTSYEWYLKDLDIDFYADFDNTGKVDRIFCELTQ
jgi:hypothetical protein